LTSWSTPVAAAPVSGKVVLPGSKSASARSLVLAAVAQGTSRLTGVLESRDTALMRAGVVALGATVADLPDGSLSVTGADPVRGGGTVDCGLAGTVLRFLPPLAALAAEPTSFVGDAAASARPVGPLLGALAALGAHVSEPHRLPFVVGGGPRFAGGTVGLDASGSSQFVSALLLAGARFAEGVEVRHTGATLPSVPHIEMTCTLLRRRGVAVTRTSATSWRVEPGPVAALDEQVEPDLTNAATFLAAALVTGGRLTTAWPADSVQAADQLAGVLEAFGASLAYTGTAGGRELTVTAADGVRAADLDLREVSELTPVAAALAAVADGPSRLRGVAHIRGHETDRLAALAAELCTLGVRATQTADGLAVTPSPRHGAVFHTYGDHRMAHAGALLGLVTPGVELDDVECTTKTLPDFPGLWNGLLGESR
jgi:3-phosphoshikimate 1-carboxyvinyltransferase